MSQLDAVQEQIEQNPNFFYYRSSGPNYIRILDTPRGWGGEFGKGVMVQAFAKQAELERAVVEIIQKARYGVATSRP